MVIINGNGAVKIEGRYVSYEAGIPAPIPVDVARRLGKPFEVVQEMVNPEQIDMRTKEEPHTKEPAKKKFPKHTGGGVYVLSNGEKVRGKSKAIEAEQNL